MIAGFLSAEVFSGRSAAEGGQGSGVLFVGDRLQPGSAVTVAVADHQGQVGHEVGVGGAVPVLLTGQALDGLTGADTHDVAVAGADQADAVGDVQGLARAWECQLVRAPGVKRTSAAARRAGSAGASIMLR